MDPESLLRTLQVALGIGLVIFVHEAGHFLAAHVAALSNKPLPAERERFVRAVLKAVARDAP